MRGGHRPGTGGEREAELFGLCFATHDGPEGIKAFFWKNAAPPISGIAKVRPYYNFIRLTTDNLRLRVEIVCYLLHNPFSRWKLYAGKRRKWKGGDKSDV